MTQEKNADVFVFVFPSEYFIMIHFRNNSMSAEYFAVFIELLTESDNARFSERIRIENRKCSGKLISDRLSSCLVVCFISTDKINRLLYGIFVISNNSAVSEEHELCYECICITCSRHHAGR